MELESDTYDVVVIGTGLAESIAAASLAKVGKTVLHLDPNEYYAADHASLTLDELVEWAKDRSAPPSVGESSTSTYLNSQRRRYTHASTSTLTPELERDKRRYALSLYPAVLPSKGPLITTLVNSGVSKYVGFRLLDSVGIYEDGQVRKAPGSKEEVFKDKSISLVDKRRLMKFLMFVAGDFEDAELLRGKEEQPLIQFLRESFSLPDKLAYQIIFAIAHCSSADEPALEALKRTRRYLQSIGKYGNGAFLVAQYGGAGEIAQGFCRACAVKGGTYVLGEHGRPTSIELSGDEPSKVKLSLPCHPTPITASQLIASTDHMPPNLSSASFTSRKATAHCIAILPSLPESLQRQHVSDGEESESQEGRIEQDDTAVVIFPPEGNTGLVRALVMGEGTGSCPAGQYILYLSSTVSSGASNPQETLRPYLDKLHPDPLFTAFYLSHQSDSLPSSTSAGTHRPIHIIQRYREGHVLTEGLDWDAEQGEAAFWNAMGTTPDDAPEGERFFEREEKDEEVDEDLG